MPEELEITEYTDNLVLTTIDNPFNPKTHYRNWKTWDEQQGYFTESFLARVADIPVDADIDDDILVEQYLIKARQLIIDNDVEEIYMLV